MDQPTRGIDETSTPTLAATARLHLTSERVLLVAPALAAMYTAFDQLDALDLGETPPATAFDARWE